MLTLSIGVAQADPGPKAPATPGGKAPATPGGKGASVVVDGRTFGPKDGLVIDEGSVVVGQAPGTISIAAYTRYNFGTSYTATNSGSTGLNYGGEAYAAANIFENLRVIQVCFQYRRNNVALHSWVCSNASSSSGTWKPGVVASKTVWDTLDPNAPPTTFHYKTSRINPSVV
jgi:hypothetical protein